MAESLKDKIVFITGASAGIGKSCAQAFAAEGSKLILTARRFARLKNLSFFLKEKYNTESIIFKLDVMSNENVQHVIARLPAEWKSVDILINNAGLAQGLAKVQDGLLEDWETMLDTNVKGLLYVTREILPGMIQRGRGHVINICSIAGYQVYPSGNVYCASKYAVRALTEGMQIDVVDTPIRVSSVSPGMAETEFSLARFKWDEERAANVYKGIDALTPDDVAEAVVFCVTRPAHVNINELIIMPTNQASAHVIHKRP